MLQQHIITETIFGKYLVQKSLFYHLILYRWQLLILKNRY